MSDKIENPSHALVRKMNKTGDLMSEEFKRILMENFSPEQLGLKSGKETPPVSSSEQT